METFKKDNECRNGQELWIKVEQVQEQYKKEFYWVKGRAEKFHKSIITFWDDNVLQPKNKQKSAAVTFSVHST